MNNRRRRFVVKGNLACFFFSIVFCHCCFVWVLGYLFLENVNHLVGACVCSLYRYSYTQCIPPQKFKHTYVCSRTFTWDCKNSSRQIQTIAKHNREKNTQKASIEQTMREKKRRGEAKPRNRSESNGIRKTKAKNGEMEWQHNENGKKTPNDNSAISYFART